MSALVALGTIIHLQDSYQSSLQFYSYRPTVGTKEYGRLQGRNFGTPTHAGKPHRLDFFVYKIQS